MHKVDQKLRTMDMLGALALEHAEVMLRDRFMRLYSAMQERRRNVETDLAGIVDPFADWHVIEMREADAKDVVEGLKARGFVLYRPERIQRERTVYGSRLVQRPFFPGYLLVRFRATVSGWAALLAMPGVTGVLMDDGKPARVPARQLEAVYRREQELAARRRLRKRLGAFPFDVDQEVEIVDGAFVGYRAVIRRLDPRGRIGLDVPGVMGRVVRIDVDPDQIRAA